jgi:short-subunit dehydrogenase
MSSARPIALVTGASSGIGAALADVLARRDYDLIVVARRRERLEALAQRLQATTAASVEVLVADLTAPADLAKVAERVAGEERLELLVNNAGFGGYAPFAQVDLEVVTQLIGIHAQAPVTLVRAALPGLIARGHGAVVNVASLLALSGPLAMRMSGRATYAAAKSFLLVFTQALAAELEGTGVHAMVCLPGMVESEFHGLTARSLPGVPIMSSEDIAVAIVSGLDQGEVVCVPGLEDVSLFASMRDLQQAALAGGNRSELATRYRHTT